MLRRTAQESATDRSKLGEIETDGDHEVWEAVARLAPRQRAVVALFYQHDLSTADIAEALGCSVSTATSHLNQARTRLASMLGEPLEGPLDPAGPATTAVDGASGRAGDR